MKYYIIAIDGNHDGIKLCRPQAASLQEARFRAKLLDREWLGQRRHIVVKEVPNESD